MSDPNPFSSPQTSSYHAPRPPGGGITPGMRRAMAQTRGWLAVLGVIGFLLAALMLMGLAAALTSESDDRLVPSTTEPQVIYLVVIIGLLLVFSTIIVAYAAQITSFLHRSDAGRLAAALRVQKVLWMLFGTVLLVQLMFQAYNIFLAIR